MTTYDAIVVPAHTLVGAEEGGTNPENRGLSERAIGRLERAIDHYSKGEAKKIILQGGPGVIVYEGDWVRREAESPRCDWIPRGTRPVIADVMRNHAISECGMDGHEKDLLMQTDSCDQVGETVFANCLYINEGALDLRNLLVITEQYNAARIKAIHDRILAPGYSTEVDGIIVGNEDDPTAIELEKDNLEAFLTQFEPLEPGNREQALQILFSKHAYYNGTHKGAKITPGQVAEIMVRMLHRS